MADKASNSSNTMLRRNQPQHHRSSPPGVNDGGGRLPLHNANGDGCHCCSSLAHPDSTSRIPIPLTPLHYVPKECHGSNWFPSVMSAIRRRWYLRYPLALLSVAIFILMFGTVYSEVTARDACQVLAETRRSDPPPNLPRLFHYQSKTNELTDETSTWMAVLGIDADGDSQEYPDIRLDDMASAAGKWTSVYWSDESCLRLVEEHFPTFADTYKSFPHTIQRVDSCRYLILSKYGGVYADTDISLHAKDANELERLIPDGVGLVESPFRYNEVWQNSLMTATATGHPFWDTVIKVMVEREGSGNVLSTTGPRMIGDAVQRYRHYIAYSSSKGRGGNIHTLPCELFQRLPMGQWDTTFLNVLGRDVLARAVPMRGCGRYGDGKCEVTRHSGKASWTKESLI